MGPKARFLELAVVNEESNATPKSNEEYPRLQESILREENATPTCTGRHAPRWQHDERLDCVPALEDDDTDAEDEASQEHSRDWNKGHHSKHPERIQAWVRQQILISPSTNARASQPRKTRNLVVMSDKDQVTDDLEMSAANLSVKTAERQLTTSSSRFVHSDCGPSTTGATGKRCSRRRTGTEAARSARMEPLEGDNVFT